MRQAQVVAPLSGKRQDGGQVQGFPINGAAVTEQQAGPGSFASPQKDYSKVEEFLSRIRTLNGEGMQANAATALSLAQQYSDQNSHGRLSDSLYALFNAMKYNSDPMRVTAGLPNPKDTIAQVEKEIRVNKDAQKDAQAAPKMAAAKTPSKGATSKSSGASAQNNAQQPYKKKKHRGDPFKVLMGMVDKLLRRNVKPRRIIRYLEQDGVFDRSTIEHAVDVVLDYAKDKERDAIKEKGYANGDSELGNDPTMERDVPGSGSGVEKTDEKARRATSFNYARHLRTAANKKDEESLESMIRKEFKDTEVGDQDLPKLYTERPEWKTRSDADLISTARWMASVKHWKKDAPQNDARRDADDKSGVAATLKAVKAELKSRGYTDAEINGDEGDE
jgi:hypothetical protein